MNIEPIEPTWHGTPVSTREDYLAALVDELLVECSRDDYNREAFFHPAPPTPDGGYVGGKTFVPNHPIERALRALAWQIKNRPSEARITGSVSMALQARGLA